MRFQPTVFGQLMQHVSRPVFRAATTGRAKWGLTDWAHLTTLVAAQVAGVRSLRDLVGLIGHHRGALAHLGVGTVSRSTLADANAKRPTTAFEAVAAQLSATIARSCGTLSRDARRLIDATRIHAGKSVRNWAVDGAVKLHVVYDPQAQRTTCFAVTSARINDITAARSFPIEPGATYVFDRGYYAFMFWEKLAAAGCRFVTRLKNNTPIDTLRQRSLPQHARHILSDRIGTLPTRLSATRSNPFTKPVRVIEVSISTGRVINLVTNDLQAPATEIAELYKSRWEIELFFKWIKQNLKLHHFLGSSRNAVTLQILAALIAFLLVRIAQLHAASHMATQAVFRTLATAFLQRRPLTELLHDPTPPKLQPDNRQTCLAFALG